MKEIIINDANKKYFADNFLKEYLSKGFGSLSKREIDILMMDLLLKYTDIKNMNNFDLSLKLKLSESKIKNLKYEANLKYRKNTEKFIRDSFLMLLEKARLKKDKIITMSIEDNFLRNAINAKVKERGSFTDTSFNSEIVKINIDDFVYLLDIFYDDNEKSKIKKNLEEFLSSDNNIDFKNLFKKFLVKAIEGAGNELGKQGILLGIGCFTNGVVPLVSNIISIINKGIK